MKTETNIYRSPERTINPYETSPLEDSPTFKENDNREGPPSLGKAPTPLIFTPTN